ncbi:MAG: CHAD domain-containing protein [Acidobacteriia bacterium]|nr:CHAD domain-containing protein [Terriglobia bacterium]
MAVDNARSLALLRKLDQSLGKTHGKPLAPHHAQKRGTMGNPLPPERVHQMRTTARRLETLLETLADHPNRRQRNLRKRLKRLRRGAGGVRDIDVQIAALRKLMIGREQERRARLMQALVEKRSEREQELVNALDHKDVQKLRKGLQRWSEEIGSGAKPEGKTPATAAREFDGVAASLRMFSTLSRQVSALTPDNLHAYRTRCKQIRYVAEMAGNTPRAKQVVEPLRRMQDAIGDWHDWQTLTQTAESLFSHSPDSALMAALHNVTNAKFVEARGLCQESRRSLMAQYRAVLGEQRTQRAPAPKPSPGGRRGKRIAQMRERDDANAPAPAVPMKASAASVGMATSSVA